MRDRDEQEGQFRMISFKNIELSDKEWIDACLKEADYQGCDYSFTSNYIWRNIYHVQVAKVMGTYCVKVEYNGKTSYSLPAGKEHVKEAIECMMEDAKERKIPFVLRGITERWIPILEEWFPDTFSITLNRDESDYIYSVDKLSTLAGKKLHGKRNHIHRFKDSGDWEYLPITEDNINECFQMNQKWLETNLTSEDDGVLEESKAVEEILTHFFELKVQGGILKRDGEVVAYTIGEPLNSEIFVVHIEKAFYNIQGAYPMINQQFVLNNCQNYLYVNREEDAGDEGLRKAKLSYYPDILLHKYYAVLKNQEV